MTVIYCIECPNGCEIRVSDEGKISGNRCRRGEEFARRETENPMRTIASTIKTIFKNEPVTPVRTSSAIPKDEIFPVMDEINKAEISAPVSRGDVIIKDIRGLGVDIIATADCPKGNE